MTTRLGLPPLKRRTPKLSYGEELVPASDGTRLYVRRREGGQVAVVLCDGILCDGFVYRHLWSSLPDSVSVFHWNYRGHGRSGDPVDPSRVTVSAHTQDLLSICRHYDLKRVVLVGHSFGVSVVLEGVGADPQLFGGMVLMCGTAGSVTNAFRGTNVFSAVLPRLRQATAEHPRLARGLWSRLPAGFASRMAVFTGEVNKASVEKQDIQPYFDHLRHINPTVAFQMLEQASCHSSEELLPRLGLPALAIAGTRDTFIPAAQTRQLAEALPSCEFHLLEGGTHVCPIEYPERVSELVNNFLRSIAK